MATLADILRRRIALAGPITVAEFMNEALNHPALGYYRRGQPLGSGGDFVTAPDVSQMFGELLGAWLAERWLVLGSPRRVRLVELGPGRGTLLRDALRATRAVPGFHDALDLHLVEIHAGLRELQRDALADFTPHWHERFADVPSGAPLLLLANEFLDALPIRQLVRQPWGWAERMVGLVRGSTEFAFAAAPGKSPLAALLPDSVRAIDRFGSIAELSPAVTSLTSDVARRIVADRGAALFIDYGYDSDTNGDTLQALRAHRPMGVFEAIGEADLTAHVDFSAVRRAALQAGASTDGPTTQGDLLRDLGIETRAALLRQMATPAQAEAIGVAMRRLIDPGQMGTLFRAIALRDPALPPAAGFI
ncbi:MAG: SAM-dependent methyltransferase [Alphaproteobacteria bacterium]|nr:SAM-dependent methyltransferase [Alphaproteobacteria bacterium]MCW5741834.1 SAM-dependent methyltransferase [Alphaproteobacteria bacterium]